MLSSSSGSSTCTTWRTSGWPSPSSTTGRSSRRLATASSGPTLTLPEPTLDAFMARWEQGNDAVARTFVRDGGELFTTLRSLRRATTEQRLDLERFEDLFARAELPDALHAPLRRIAEREARR